MGIGAKFVMLLPILCFLQLSHSMDDGCNRTNRETVKDLMSLITRLFDQKTNLDVNILPQALRKISTKSEDKLRHYKRLAMTKNLLYIISERESLEEINEDNIVKVLKAVFDNLYKEICNFLESENVIIDCSNVRETKRLLLLLKFREQTINSLQTLKRTNNTIFEKNNVESYVTWHKVVEPDVKEKTRGILGDFPNYSATCACCSLNPCPMP